MSVSSVIHGHVRSESAPLSHAASNTSIEAGSAHHSGSYIPESESLAFDSSDEVTPLVETIESEEASLATSTTNVRSMGQGHYGSSRSRRASYHSQRDSMDGSHSRRSGIVSGRSSSKGGWKLDPDAEKERQADMEALQQLQSRSVDSRRCDQSFLFDGGVGSGAGKGGRPSNGSDESDDAEETWRRSENHTKNNNRRYSGFYDGLSSAHSSDSEGVKRRAIIKPRSAIANPLPLFDGTSPLSSSPQNSSTMNATQNSTQNGATTNGAAAPAQQIQAGSTFRAASVDDRIKINVGGRIFETYVTTLRKYPHTLLGTMLHPRNAHLLGQSKSSPDGKPSPDTELFFDRNPRMFEVILDFYRTSQIHRPPDVSWEALQEELSFFQIDLPEYTNLSKRVSIELRKLEYKDLILPASEYRKMTRVKLLKEHHNSITRILDFIQQKIQRKADAGHNASTITFYSPLHYTSSTPREIFKVISTNEIRELLVELLRSKDFHVRETFEYSKTKTTSIIGLHDQIINYNDPQYFSFHIKW